MPRTEVRRVLREVFGLRSLRAGQGDVVDRVLSRESTLAVMPTGAGKSLCYQLPALLLPGCTVVVSPLIALMKDQCEKLRGLGVDAVQLNSHCSADEIRRAELAIARGEARIILITPEGFVAETFVSLIRSQRIAFVVVDEAHCIVQWGHDFRPAFLDVADTLAALGKPPVLALTATASDPVADEIMSRLHIPREGRIHTGAFRPNLHYAVEQLENDEARHGRVLQLVAEAKGSGIVYAATVREAVEVHDALQGRGESAGLYHGRLAAPERRAAQEDFMSGKVRVMVATNAFGMGIDKPDIRFVVHCQMPASLDAYYQESGRAGRDGEDAHCTLLFLRRDKSLQQFFKAGRYPDAKDIRAVHTALASANGEHEATTPSALAKNLHLPLRTVQQVIHMLRQHGVVARDRARGLRAAGAELRGEAVQKMLDDYAALRTRDSAVLEEIVFYAQTGRCRWQVVLDHLEGPAERPRCDRCDNCARMAQQEASVTPTSEPATPPPRELAFARGEKVKVRRYGVGAVAAADGATVTIEFADGSSRCFHPDFVQAVRPEPRRRTPVAVTGP